jgi:hypothetical protein
VVRGLEVWSWVWVFVELGLGSSGSSGSVFKAFWARRSPIFLGSAQTRPPHAPGPPKGGFLEMETPHPGPGTPPVLDTCMGWVVGLSGWSIAGIPAGGSSSSKASERASNISSGRDTLVGVVLDWGGVRGLYVLWVFRY